MKQYDLENKITLIVSLPAAFKPNTAHQYRINFIVRYQLFQIIRLKTLTAGIGQFKDYRFDKYILTQAVGIRCGAST